MQTARVIRAVSFLLCRFSVVAVELLYALATLLCFQRQRRSRSSQQTRDSDRLTGFLAVAVGAPVDHLERLLDLLEQLALAVARTQLQRIFLFERSPVRRVGGDFVL